MAREGIDYLHTMQNYYTNMTVVGISAHAHKTHNYPADCFYSRWHVMSIAIESTYVGMYCVM